ncbi:MAG: hypothetical protein U0996_10690 [Planctomycetaceae bacterium]
MASVRVGPWGQLPNVKREDVVYLDLQENWDEFADEIPDWFRQWRGLDDWQHKLEELLCLELCPVLEEFTRRLFDTIVPCGIMHCKVTHRMEPRRTWLVSRQRTRQRRKYSVKTLEVLTLSGTPESLILRGRKARVYGSEENVSEVEGHPSAVHRRVQE